MLAFVIQRLLQALVVMLVISALVFIGVYAVGNPIDVMISPDATQQIREQAIRAYGFDQPLWRQYFTFLERLATGDFGRSFVYNTPVLGLILSRLPATLEITLAAVIGATLIGIPLGMYAGYRPDSRAGEVDHGALRARLFGAHVLDRADPDLHVCRQPGRAAGGRTR